MGEEIKELKIKLKEAYDENKELNDTIKELSNKISIYECSSNKNKEFFVNNESFSEISSIKKDALDAMPSQ